MCTHAQGTRGYMCTAGQSLGHVGGNKMKKIIVMVLYRYGRVLGARKVKYSDGQYSDGLYSYGYRVLATWGQGNQNIVMANIVMA